MISYDLHALTSHLWPDIEGPPSEQVYWLLDGARDPAISKLVREGELSYRCLYHGRLTPRLEAAAPYLVHLVRGVAPTMELLGRGWGNAWGILIVAPASLDILQLRLHLKKFLRVQSEDGKLLMFRFYDPRVLSVFLPTCTAEQFTQLLGPLKSLIVESSQDSQWRVFDLDKHAQAMRVQIHADGALMPC